IFHAQEINADETQIHYAATDFEGAALYWYLNRVIVAENLASFDD
ncbi:15285_t:CDS:1, partial [Racocetra fulgida]